jgi:hypothetical protein
LDCGVNERVELRIRGAVMAADGTTPGAACDSVVYDVCMHGISELPSIPSVSITLLVLPDYSWLAYPRAWFFYVSSVNSAYKYFLFALLNHWDMLCSVLPVFISHPCLLHVPS